MLQGSLLGNRGKMWLTFQSDRWDSRRALRGYKLLFSSASAEQLAILAEVMFEECLQRGAWRSSSPWATPSWAVAVFYGVNVLCVCSCWEQSFGSIHTAFWELLASPQPAARLYKWSCTSACCSLCCACTEPALLFWGRERLQRWCMLFGAQCKWSSG